MPPRRQPASHSIDLGSQSSKDSKFDSTRSGLLSNGVGYDDSNDNGNVKQREKAAELSSGDMKAIALLVVLCKCHSCEGINALL
jgi:hypothetical protein